MKNKMTRIGLLALALGAPGFVGAADPLKIEGLRTCHDASGKFAYVVTLTGPVHMFNYAAHVTDPMEDAFRKNTYATLLANFQSGKKVKVTSYSSATTNLCGVAATQIQQVYVDSQW